MRVANDHPLRNGGYLHPLNGERKYTLPEREPEKPTIDATEIFREWEEKTNYGQRCRLANEIGVSNHSICAINCAWAPEHNAFAFPMRDGNGKIVGIRLRASSGKKWSVTGSKDGLFFAPSEPHNGMAVICEGASDACAAITLGLYPLGRSSCSSGVRHILTACERFGIRRAILLPDNDAPGLQGAERLSDMLEIPHAYFIPATKDLRELLQLAGQDAKLMIESTVKNMVWRVPKC